MQESGNNRGDVEVMRVAQLHDVSTETTETFPEARWRIDEDDKLWIIGVDGPVATFAHGYWGTVRYRAEALSEA